MFYVDGFRKKDIDKGYFQKRGGYGPMYVMYVF